MIMFRGSGVSLASVLPGVRDIRNELHKIADHTRAKQLIQVLEELNTDYLQNSAPFKSSSGRLGFTGQLFRTETTYEDLFYLVYQIEINGEGRKADVTIEAFADLLRRKARGFLRGRTKQEQGIDLHGLAYEIKKMIESTVASLLYCTDAKGLDLVSDLAMSDLVDELNIVTLNHDTLVEQVLAANGIDFSDGFGGPDGDVRWFEGGRSKVAQWELACNPWEDHDLIFPRETSGKPMRYTSLNNAYRQICMEAGVEYRSFHILRHTCASLLLSQGESIKLVQKQLRHRDVKVTLSTYTHLLPEAGPEALKKLIPRSWASNELSNEWGPNRSTRVHNHLHR